eukprot:TRINITY_DN2596_c0_g1_i1.p1 TRINITY_DN2596_c0_g1~~TRINITY_DN2596_c0_g1_i1.p1  ORF type:complete len:122 (+),score=36.60 TRINITY_DN2596_c0_g1_i1:49-366(+)
MVVEHITSKSRFDTAISSGSQLVVVDYYATWCGPCKRISPFLDQLSEKMTNVTFIKVDVDELEDVAKAQEISAMPTFHLYKGGKRVGELVGASQDQLQKLIEDNQ